MNAFMDLLLDLMQIQFLLIQILKQAVYDCKEARPPTCRVEIRAHTAQTDLYYPVSVNGIYPEIKFYIFQDLAFPDLFSEVYFWLEKCEHEARSCTCHSPRTVQYLHCSCHFVFVHP